MKRHPRTWFILSFPVFLSSLLACSDAPPWTGSVEVRDGVEVISNPGEPLVGEGQLLVSELWAIQDPAWVDPSRIHVQAGLLTLVDPPANQVHEYSTSGEHRASIGRQGGGPGEFLRLLDAIPHGGRLVVIDGGKGSIEYLDLDGNYLSSLHIEGQAWGGFPLDGETLLIKGEFLSDPSEETLGDWVRVTEGQRPASFSAPPLDPLPEEQGIQCSDLFSWEGGAARMRFTTPQIQVLDHAGNLKMESTIDLPVEVVSESERESALAELTRTQVARGLPPAFIEQSLVVMEERWKVKCRFGALRPDPSGQWAAFLEQNPDQFGAGNATLHVLSRDGIYLAKVAFPTAWKDFAIEDGVVYALTRDPTTDLATLKAIRVEIPGSLFTDATRILDEALQPGL